MRIVLVRRDGETVADLLLHLEAALAKTGADKMVIDEVLPEIKRGLRPEEGNLNMNEVAAQLFADVTLYTTDNGGRLGSTPPEWFGCPCKINRDDLQGWDCRFLLGGIPMSPGDTRRVGITFLSPESALPKFRAAGVFFLWEGRVIGEARVA